MDELDFDGKKYISSKRAATLTGYAKDYVGQLCREGRVDARLVGRSWYVYEESIRKHRFKDEEETQVPEDMVVPAELPVEVDEQTSDAVEPSEITNKQATWEHATYTPEILEEVVPITESVKINREDAELHPDLTEMQDAWKSWFEESHQKPIKSPVEDLVIDTEESGSVIPIHTPQKQVEPERVHIDIDIPSEIKVEPVAPPAYTSSNTERSYREQRYADTTPVKETSYLAVKALCVAIVILSSSLTFVALGFGQTEGSYRGIPVLESLSGETVVE